MHGRQRSVLDNGAAQDMPSPPPDLTAEEAATLVQGEAALRGLGEEQLEPPAPIDIGGEYITNPDDAPAPPTPALKSKLHIVGIDFPSGKKSG